MDNSQENVLSAKLDSLDKKLNIVTEYVQSGVLNNKKNLDKHIEKTETDIKQIHERINRTREIFDKSTKEIMQSIGALRIETLKAGNRVWIWFAMTFGAAAIGYVVTKILGS